MTPFKKPFKGKRAIQRELVKAEIEFAVVRKEMEALCDLFRATFRKPRFVLLRVHVIGNSAARLRWRTMHAATGSQKDVNLFGSDKGRNVLRQFPRAAREVLEEFEQERMRLNMRSIETHWRLVALKEYLEAWLSLDESRRMIGESDSGAA